MPWIRKRLRGAKVWVRCDGKGDPVLGPDQRADVLYQTRGKIYRASPRNLGADDDPLILSDEEAAPSGLAESKPDPAAGTPAATRGRPGHGKVVNGPLAGPKDRGPVPDGAIHVYTDGACTGNPGPMGIGVVVLGEDIERQEMSEYLGTGTNNVAELTAILRGLEGVSRDKTVIVYSDSAYALGLLGKNWKAKANQQLVEKLRKVAKEFPDLRLVKVAGHAGIEENERCDELARAAVLRRR